jgi:hypothetical protein
VARTHDEAKQLAMSQPMRFVENRGQIHDVDGSKRPEVAYYANAKDAQLYFTSSGIGYVFEAEPWPSQKRFVMEMELIGSNKDVKISGQDRAQGVFNFLKGSKEEWIIGVPGYNKLVYENVYRNIDMVVQTHEMGVKYDFVVRPGGNVKDIRFQYNGASKIGISDEGKLKVQTPVGFVEEQAPFSYQGETPVGSSFRMNGNEVSFQVANYDHSQTLVIDPVAAWSTFFGDSGPDQFMDVEIDVNGVIDAVGWSESTTITSAGMATKNARAGGATSQDRDGLIARFNANGSLEWWSFLGGSGTDEIHSVEIDGGNVYVMGKTFSGTNFPTASSVGAPVQTTYGGSGDAFVTCLDNGLSAASGGTIRWSTYKGGASLEEGLRISVRTINNVRYIAGTGSTSTGFPVAPSPTTTPASCATAINTTVPAQPTAPGATGGGSREAFVFYWVETNVGGVASGTPTNATESWATYLGGVSDDEGTAIEINGAGDVYVGGWTKSAEKTGANPNGLPTGNASITSQIPAGAGGTAEDGYVGKFSQAGCLLCLGYIGGSGNDRVLDGAMGNDDAGRERFMVGGSTTSDGFSGVASLAPGCGQSTRGGAGDGFLTILTDQCVIGCTTYHGGQGEDVVTDIDVLENSIAVGGRTTVLVCGNTDSPGTGTGRMPISPGDNQAGSNAPPLGTYGAANNGSKDMWAACFDMRCCRLWSTFWGGTQNDFAEGITAKRFTNEDRVIVAGYTGSYTPAGGGQVPYPVQRSGATFGATAFQQSAMPQNTSPDAALLGITFAPDEKLSIDLASFSISAEGTTVHLNWRTASEENNEGFEIQRKVLDNPYDQVEFTKIASHLTNTSLSGLGTSAYGKSYSYIDHGDLQPGKYYIYRLVDISHDGIRTEHPSMSLKLESGVTSPVFSFRADVSPNPATEGFINLNFSLPNADKVTVEIYSVDGKKIATPISKEYGAGPQAEMIPLDGLAPGVYTAMISTGNYTTVRTRQFVVVR